VGEERMKFNINDCVKVKLTPRGVELLALKHASLKRQFPKMHDFQMPEIDAEGYTKYQLWELMHNFGDCIVMGAPLPFETTMELI
jgi:hypothetical protein